MRSIDLVKDFSLFVIHFDLNNRINYRPKKINLYRTLFRSIALASMLGKIMRTKSMISHQINSNNIYSALKQITMKVNIIELPKLMLAGLVTIGVMGFSSLEAEASCPTYDLRSASSNVKRALTIVNKIN